MGLGNPGPEYFATRHNAGFLLADHLVGRWGLPPFRRAGLARRSAGTIGQTAVEVLKPLTYVNRSGRALGPVRARADFDPTGDLLVLVDDVALPVGRFRIRAGGSAGGHNGLKDIEASLRGANYARLRIGVGPVPPGLEDLAGFILAPLAPKDREVLETLLKPMAEAIDCWLTEGIEPAMNRFNR